MFTLYSRTFHFFSFACNSTFIHFYVVVFFYNEPGYQSFIPLILGQLAIIYSQVYFFTLFFKLMTYLPH